MKKHYRTIEQEALICSYQSTDQYQFDFNITKQRQMDEFELIHKENMSNNKFKKPNDDHEFAKPIPPKTLELYRKMCHKQKRQMDKIQESYDALKSRRFRVRRGRNNRILYKSQLKTIFEYDS